MKVNKSSSAGDFQLLSSFEEIRAILADNKYDVRRQKPLAYWVLPTDRRLPLAFLGLTLDDIITKPFEEIAATAGIGHKKIGTLVKLLHRAAHDKQPDSPYGLDTLAQDELQAWSDATQPEEFDPDTVSESHWTLWRDTVRRHDMGSFTLGGLAPTLKSLPTVIWDIPIGDYLDCTLAELRSKRTHGEKRVRVVLEVFFIVHRMLGNAEPQRHLRFSLLPKFIEPLEDWINAALQSDEPPTSEEIFEHLIDPVLQQVEVDAGADVREISEGRLGTGEQHESVRSQARRLGVTRARVYQLLEEVGKVMAVRWPLGRLHISAMLTKFWPEPLEGDLPAAHLLYSTRDLLFPTKASAQEEELAEEIQAVG